MLFRLFFFISVNTLFENKNVERIFKIKTKIVNSLEKNFSFHFSLFFIYCYLVLLSVLISNLKIKMRTEFSKDNFSKQIG